MLKGIKQQVAEDAFEQLRIGIKNPLTLADQTNAFFLGQGFMVTANRFQFRPAVQTRRTQRNPGVFGPR